MFPAKSCTVTVIVWVPSGNNVPAIGDCVMLNEPNGVQLSDIFADETTDGSVY